MKNNKLNYFIILLFLNGCLINAQVLENFEDCENNPPFDCIDSWGCGGSSNCCFVCTKNQSYSGNYSGYINDNGITDVIVDLGNKIFGNWSIEFWLYIPSNKVGYFNLQGTVPIGGGEFPVGNIFFNKDNANPGLMEMDDAYNDDDDPAPSFNEESGSHEVNFPHDQWFRLQMNWDLSMGMSLATWEFIVDDCIVISAGTPYKKDSDESYVTTSLGGFDFFSISSDNQLYIDDFIFQEGITLTNGLNCNLVSTEDYLINKLKIFPNPTKNKLFIKTNIEKINSTIVYSILGKQIILQNNDSKIIDLSNLKMDIYILKINTENGNFIKKIIKH